MFSNSGDNQETHQYCGNSCTGSSSNIIRRVSVMGTTSPTPSPTSSQTPVLSVNANSPNGIVTVAGRLTDESGNGLGGRVLTVTGVY